MPRLLPLLLCLLSSLLLSAQDTGKARDAWQRPAEVMDTLGVSSGSVVADIGAGNGYFTFHLAERVGLAGRVYAVEVDEDALEKINQRARKELLGQIEGVLGVTDDPRWPPSPPWRSGLETRRRLVYKCKVEIGNSS